MSGFGAHECHTCPTCPTCPDARCPETQPSGKRRNRQRKPWSPLENGGLLGLIHVDTLLVAFKSSTHNFPFAAFAFSHFASEVYFVLPHPDFPRTLCFACTVNFKFCHCEAVDTLPVSFPPAIRFDPDQPVINHSSF